MFSKKVWIMLCLILAAILASCNSTGGTQPKDSPESVVADFYTWFLADPAAGPKDPLESEALAPELVKRIQQARAENDIEQAVNFVCAQDFPERMDIEETSLNGDEATVKVKSSFGNTITVVMKVYDGEWKISDVSCK